VSCVFSVFSVTSSTNVDNEKNSGSVSATSKAVADTINPTRYEPGIILSMSNGEGSGKASMRNIGLSLKFRNTFNVCGNTNLQRGVLK
jgi:hypothetical protein